MINLGFYSGRKGPAVHFRPTVTDRVLEALALLVLLATWGSICWLCFQREVSLQPDVWLMGGCSVFSFLFLGGLAYLPVRFFNFPVRLTVRNAAFQYVLAVRLVRVMNVGVLLLSLGAVWELHSEGGKLLLAVAAVLLALAFVAYYVLAFLHR